MPLVKLALISPLEWPLVTSNSTRLKQILSCYQHTASKGQLVQQFRLWQTVRTLMSMYKQHMNHSMYEEISMLNANKLSCTVGIFALLKKQTSWSNSKHWQGVTTMLDSMDIAKRQSSTKRNKNLRPELCCLDVANHSFLQMKWWRILIHSCCCMCMEPSPHLLKKHGLLGRSNWRNCTLRLPPDQDSLNQHCERANYLAYIQLNYDLADHPSPAGHCWELVNGKYKPVQCTCDALPTEPTHMHNLVGSNSDSDIPSDPEDDSSLGSDSEYSISDLDD